MWEISVTTVWNGGRNTTTETVGNFFEMKKRTKYYNSDPNVIEVRQRKVGA